LLGIDIKPLFGYEGATEVWLGFLRGELDFAPMADSSAKRNLATGANARVSMIMTEHEHPDFPGVPYLGGQGGLIDLRFKQKPPAERRRAMELGSLAISLSDSTRTLIASKKLHRDLLSCLESAAQATLLDPDLAAEMGRQKLMLAPLDAKATDTKMRVLQATLNKHSDYLKSIASRVKTER
jgi:tripartite-type tricarboxylate transporter receptor subunit TctC